MITVSDVSVSFGGQLLFKDVDLKFTAGNCYGVIGANGAGKSTFLKVLCGDLEPTKGSVSKPAELRMSVLRQDHYAFDDYTVQDTVILGNKRLYDIMQEKDALYAKEDFSEEDGTRASELEAEFAELNGWEAESDASKLIQGLGLPEEILTQKMDSLTGNEKVKVLLAQCLFGNPDIILMDEPTNHLDAASREELENTLLHYDGTMLIVSHDRYFINKLATRVLELPPNGVQSYTGNYDDYMAHRAVTQQRTAAVKEKPKTNSYKEQKERASRLRKLRTAVTRLEAEIEETEAEIEELQAQLSAGADYQALMDLTAKLDAATARRDDLYARWENASEELADGEEKV